MTEGAPLILDLLTYIEQVEKLKTKPAFAVPTEHFAAYQYELKGLPELQFNVQNAGDDVWLRVPRLRELAPPEADPRLALWVTLPKTPAKDPVLKTEIATYADKKQVGVVRLEDEPDIQVLFDAYVDMQWRPWAITEIPRRKTIAIYNKLFSLQQVISSDAESALELIWGVGLATWKKDGFGTPLKHPLILQACEIALNERSFDLEIRPRNLEPRLEADCYTEMGVPGVRPLEAFWKSALANGAHRVNPFEVSTYEGVLKAAVGHLDPNGSYDVLVDDTSPPPAGEKLRITNTWVLYARKRSSGIFLEDINRLKKNIEAVEKLPGVIRSFVETGDDTLSAHLEQSFRGLSSSESPSDAFELYFPMAYNDEQVSIVRKLEHGNGVVVQGPPGTGKTHTIANIVCHYLARGKRVLVTSKGESALAEVLGKLPDRIKPLCVSLLSNERDGMKQFEHAIQTIAANVASTNPVSAAASIAALEQKLNQLHAKISYVDRSVADFASKHMRNYSFQGKDYSPEDIAKIVLTQADEHDWFTDQLPLGTDDFDYQLPFDESAISRARQARIKVGPDLKTLGDILAMPDEFPAWSTLVEIHRDLLRARAIESELTQGTVLKLTDSTFETFEKAKQLIVFLDQRRELKQKLAQQPEPLLDVVGQNLRKMKADDLLLTSLLQSCADLQGLEVSRQRLVAKAVDVPAESDTNDDLKEAIGRLVQGKSAFSLPFGKGDARKLLQAVTVLGIAPKTTDDWVLAQEAIEWRMKARQCIAHWNSVSGEFGLESQKGDTEVVFRRITALQKHVTDLHRLAFEFDHRLHSRVSQVFGRVTADRLWDGGEAFVATVSGSLQTYVDKGRLAYAMNRIGDLVKKLENRRGKVVDDLQDFFSKTLGQSGTDEAELHRRWLALQAELSRLIGLRPALDDIAQVAGLVERAGAPVWASRIRTVEAESDHDPVTPSSWREAWNWRCAVMFLDHIDGHDKMRELFAQRKALTTALARAYQDIVAEKTWLGVYENSPSAIRQALQAYLNAVQSMGAGTGIRAIRYRRDAREAMTSAYRAVPCWILPEWRISETIPAEVGLFDLVIIDEASQSDIWALPALLRGKKLLVVGDHKQVSPSAIGVPEQQILELKARFLGNQPHQAQMTPEKSIYDLARVVFAGNSVMLQEHFRCVPAIIEFSNREFYQGDIRPLRLPHASERLDPPLIDVFVKGGYRQGDVNHAEAKAIVDEIEAILADEALSGRSIGVVTLLGTAQSAHIQELVSVRISPVDVVARNIAVGPPPVFQGRERDIMLVSMVLAPGNQSAQNRADQHQRFNVALSRARDRMYLFRSVPHTEFAEETLNGKLMRHFRQPFRQDVRSTQVLRERCESGFEFEMFDELVRKGYRVEPQVRCGAYRIDFVVEGREGRRLAVECDGDQFHGPGQWSDDMIRQRVLERAGWTFWRCFASSFSRRREEVLRDLFETLEGLGIEPLGSETVDNTVWVHSREVDPFVVEPMPTEPNASKQLSAGLGTVIPSRAQAMQPQMASPETPVPWWKQKEL